MATRLPRIPSKDPEKASTLEENQGKINEVRRLIGPLSEKLSIYCSDASISRYLRARNWNVKKTTKMLQDSLKWRLKYRPEDIRWEEVAPEASTGKVYRTNYMDKQGRAVLVMRPSCQNSKSTKAQIRYLVYCMENAILNLPPGEEQMVWLIDFQGFNLSNISVKVTRETARLLQNHYPERLGFAILFNPPKFFEPFWTVVKPFLEPKTCAKVKFVYSDNDSTVKILADLFEMDQLESAFGGNNTAGFDIDRYADRMREEDKKMACFWRKDNDSSSEPQASVEENFTGTNSDSDSETCTAAQNDDCSGVTDQMRNDTETGVTDQTRDATENIHG